MSSTHGCLTPPREDSKHTQGIDLQKAVRQLAYSKEIMVKQWGLTALLKALLDDRIISSQDDLDLYFAGRLVAKLPCCVFSHGINDAQTPLLVYTDNFEVAGFREDSIPIPKCNLLVWRIQEATLARLQPTNIEQDPYLVGVPIALA